MERVLILAPTLKDATTTERLLKDEGLSAFICQNLKQLCQEVARGAGAAIIPEETLLADREGELTKLLKEQPAWSDFPVIVLTRTGPAAHGTLAALSASRHFTLIERPVQIAVLLSTIRAAIRDRQRQYQMRDHIILLEKTDESLRNADRKKDEFLAILGHELRNPLAAISSGITLLNRPSVKEEVKEFAYSSLQHQVKVMAHLINDLLDVSRITNGKIVLQKTPVNLCKLLNQLSESMKFQFEASGDELIKDIEDGIWISADSARLEQIFNNLLSNAIKYSNKGSKIWFTARKGEGHACITIRDSGVGISQELLPKIFDLFTQAENSLARSQGGLGIGLTLVKKLVEMHGGEVTVESAGKDQGSTFSVKFPLTEKPPEKTSVIFSPRRVTQGRRVLVVDDNQDAARNLAHFLTDCGCDVQIAFNSAEAFDKAQMFRPEAALLDIGLPDISGYELASKFQASPELQDTLLIALTGYNKVQDRQLSKISGFKHHLAKPVDHDLLVSLLA